MIPLHLYRIQQCLEKDSLLAPAEVVVGYAPLSYPFSVASYHATVTEALPLNPFDRAICGVLNIEEGLSKEEIGNILGLQLIDNPSAKVYRDPAEAKLLEHALTCLQNEGMIDGGDTSFSYCCLTRIGKEYFSKGMKFKETEKYRFSLYFDHMGEVKQSNRAALQRIEQAAMRIEEIDLPDIKEEVFVKEIARYQNPTVYKPDSKFPISFKNLETERVKTYEAEIWAVLILHLASEQTRWIAYVPDFTKHDAYLTEVINKQARLLEKPYRQVLTATYASDNVPAGIGHSGWRELIELDRAHGKALESEDMQALNANWQQVSLIPWYRFLTILPGILDAGLQECWLWQEDLPEVEVDTLIQKLQKSADKSPRIFIMLNQGQAREQWLEKLNEAYPGVRVSVDLTSEQSCWAVSEGQITIWKKTSQAFTVDSEVVAVQMAVRQSFDLSKYTEYHARKEMLIKPDLERLHQRLIALEQNVERVEGTENLDLALSSYSDTKAEFSSLTQGWQPAKDSLFHEIHTLIETVSKKANRTYNWLFRELRRDWQKKTQNVHPSEIDLNELQVLRTRVDQLKQLGISLDSETGKLIDLEKEVASFITKAEATQQQVTYVIDTNIFIHTPDILDRIPQKDQPIVLAKVLDELDNLKRSRDDSTAYGARQAIKSIRNALKPKAERPVKRGFANPDILPDDFDKRAPDNLILAVALAHKKEPNLILLTDDQGLQAKAAMLDIAYLTTQDLDQLSTHIKTA